VSRDRFLVWDFDGTLAVRPGNWTAVVCELVARARPDLGMTAERLRPHLQSGFPWHTPEVVRAPCSAEEWWRGLLPVLARAVQRASGVGDVEARRLVAGARAAYLDAKRWQVFDDVPELAALIDALGLGDLITAVHCSGCTGVEKPHPRAFEAVFAAHPVRSTHPDAPAHCPTLTQVIDVVGGPSVE
jgi:putative hydrolase of the HAD superfamily